MKNNVSVNNIKEVKVVKSKKKRFILLYIAIFGFAVYSTITLVNQYIQIDQKKQELQNLEDKIVVQEIKNDDITNVYNYTDEEFKEYIEKIARDDRDYIKKGERIFINVSGD